MGRVAIFIMIVLSTALAGEVKGQLFRRCSEPAQCRLFRCVTERQVHRVSRITNCFTDVRNPCVCKMEPTRCDPNVSCGNCVCDAVYTGGTTNIWKINVGCPQGTTGQCYCPLPSSGNKANINCKHKSAPTSEDCYVNLNGLRLNLVQSDSASRAQYQVNVGTKRLMTVIYDPSIDHSGLDALSNQFGRPQVELSTHLGDITGHPGAGEVIRFGHWELHFH